MSGIVVVGSLHYAQGLVLAGTCIEESLNVELRDRIIGSVLNCIDWNCDARGDEIRLSTAVVNGPL